MNTRRDTLTMARFLAKSELRTNDASPRGGARVITIQIDNFAVRGILCVVGVAKSFNFYVQNARGGARQFFEIGRRNVTQTLHPNLNIALVS